MQDTDKDACNVAPLLMKLTYLPIPAVRIRQSENDKEGNSTDQQSKSVRV